MFKNLLNPESPLMITLSQVTDAIFLSLFWLIGCFPVVTAGASFAALYDASFRTYRRGEKHSWQRFGHVLRTNWKAGIVPTLVVLAAFYGLLRGLIVVWNGAVAQELSFGVFAGCALVAMVLLGILSLVFPLLSRFENSCGALLKNAVLLGLGHMPRTLCLGILNAVTIVLCVRYVAPLFFLPALSALLGSLLIEPIFKPFMEEAA